MGCLLPWGLAAGVETVGDFSLVFNRKSVAGANEL
jgi:hypothetical protein